MIDVGKRALLIKISGKATKLSIADRVSAFFVFKPKANESPDQASPKKAKVTKMSNSPPTPVAILRPSSIATPIIMADWAMSTSMSLIKRPSKIADLLAGVKSTF
jgi:hypothetical protein